jgi:hypothetical protein
LQDGATIKDLKYLSKRKSISGTYLIYHLFARGRATSKHGGGGRYDVILEFKGEKIKKFRKKERKKEKNIYIHIYMRKREKYEYVQT